MDKIELKPGMKFYCGFLPFEGKKVTGWYEEIVDCFEDGEYAAAEFTDGFGHNHYSIIKWLGDRWQIVGSTISDDYWEMKANGRI